MLKPFKFLWQQLNGPQIRALFTATFQRIKSKINPTLDYLNTLSIETATSEHLDMIGALMGIPRPILLTRDLSQLVFDDLYNDEPATPNPDTRGFSDARNPDPVVPTAEPTEPWNTDISQYVPYPYSAYSVGRFAGASNQTTFAEPLATELYRAILLEVSKLDECEPTSLACMDAILYAVTTYCKQTDIGQYSIRIFDDWLVEDGIVKICPGDIQLLPGARDTWLNLSQAEAIFNCLCGKSVIIMNNNDKSLWSPEPKVDYIFV